MRLQLRTVSDCATNRHRNSGSGEHIKKGDSGMEIEERMRLEYFIETIIPRICDLEELPDRTHEENAELTKLWAERDDAENQLNASL